IPRLATLTMANDTASTTDSRLVNSRVTRKRRVWVRRTLSSRSAQLRLAQIDFEGERWCRLPYFDLLHDFFFHSRMPDHQTILPGRQVFDFGTTVGRRHVKPGRIHDQHVRQHPVMDIAAQRHQAWLVESDRLRRGAAVQLEV